MRFLLPALALFCFATLPPVRAADGPWEDFPDGSRGLVTEYRGVNDTAIAAYLRLPKGHGPFPVVVMIHGGGSSQPGTYQLGRMRDTPTASFIAEGWAVFAIDFRLKSEWQPIEWDDACRAVTALRAMPFVDAKRIALIGGSHGAYNTVRVAARCDLACAVACAPPALNLAEVAKAKAAGYALSPALERVLANPPAIDAPEVFDEVGKVRCPLLLSSGENDTSSPPPVLKSYAAKLRTAGKEVELYLPANGHHGYYFGQRGRIPETEELARRAVAFIRKHFGLPPAGRSAQTKQAKQPPGGWPVEWSDTEMDAPSGTKYATFFSRTIGAEVSYLVYLPPEYESSGARRFPVIYWLHGGGGTQRTGVGFVEHLAAASNAQQAPPAIVVLVNGLRESCYSDSKDGRIPMETVFVMDLIPHIDATYRTIAANRGRAIEGFSMGGWGALRLGFRHPDLFGAISALGPAVLSEKDNPLKIPRTAFQKMFSGDLEALKAASAWTAAEQNATAVIRAKPSLRIVVGDADPLHPLLKEYRQRLDQLGIACDYTELSGVKHNYRTLYETLGDRKAFEFYTDSFGDGIAAVAKSSYKAGLYARAEEERLKYRGDGKSPVAWKDPMQPDSDLLHYETFNSKAAGEEVSCLVYLPPGYKRNSTARFPVLYWLHGSGGRQITGAGVVERLDKVIAAGKAPEMIVVLVNGFDTMYCDPVDGSRPVESVIVKDLIPHIDAKYRTIADRKGRGIEGFSMGGFGAGHLGFKYPEVFGVVSILAPAQLGPELAQIADKAGGVNARFLQFVQDLFGGDMQKFLAQDPFHLVEKNAEALRGRTHVRLHTHTLPTRGNWVVPRCQDLSAKLNALGLEHEFKIHWDIDKHNYRLLYDDMGENAFVFYQNAFAAAKEAKL